LSALSSLVDDLVSTAADAATRRDWVTVSDTIEDALTLDPGHAEASALLALAARHLDQRAHARRRQLTVMFCDLVGSTAQAEQLDPEVVQSLLNGYRDICASAIERYGGTIHQYIGDGMIAYFSYPRAHEDDSRRAVFAGLALQEELQQYSAAMVAAHGVEVAARVGIHTGLVAIGSLTVRGRVEDGVIAGNTPNTAARIESAADPGEVWISDVTRALVEAYVETESAGPVDLKGLSRRVELHRVLGRTGARSRLDIARPDLSPFVGRTAERGVLFERWAETRQAWIDGEHSVDTAPVRPILLVGDPGVGKSRLTLVLRRQATGDGGIVLEFHGEPFIRAPLGPFVDGLRRVCGIFSNDADPQQIAKLSEHLEQIDRLDLLALLARLLDVAGPDVPVPEMSPLQLRGAMIGALRDWLETVAATAPTLILIEDAHWADMSTIEVIAGLIESPPAGALVVITSRPEADHWNRDSLDELPVGPLPEADATVLAGATRGGAGMADDVLSRIVERADGVPLYIEQLVGIASEGGSESIPPSLRDLLQTQLDQLGDAVAIAQVAATIGREFDRDTLAAVFARLADSGAGRVTPRQLDDALLQLSDAGMIVARRVGEGRLKFRHALLSDAAYECQLLSERTERHAAVAEVLVASGVAEREASRVAAHFERAGNHPAAISHYLAGIERAAADGEFVEALSLAASAEALLDHLDDPVPWELAIRMARGAARSASEGLAAEGLEAEFDRCRDLCRLLADREDAGVQLLNVAGGLWSYYVTRGRLAEAAAITADSERVAESSDDDLYRAYAISQRGTESMFAGRWSTARDELETAVAMFDAIEGQPHQWVTPHDTHAASMALLATVAALTGDVGRSEEMMARSLERAGTLPFPRGPYSVAFARIYETWIQRMLGDHEGSERAAVAAVEIGLTYGFVDWQLLGQLHLLAAQAWLDENPDGMREMTPVLDLWHQLGAGVALPVFLITQAELFVRAGDLEAAAEHLDRTFRFAMNGGADSDQPAAEPHRQDELLAEAHRVQSHLLARRGADPIDVRMSLECAIEVADRQGAHLIALKTLCDMHELLALEDRPVDLGDRTAATLARCRFGTGPAPLLDRARELLAT
jgi:class 3 adenylate cyclase